MKKTTPQIYIILSCTTLITGCSTSGSLTPEGPSGNIDFASILLTDVSQVSPLEVTANRHVDVSRDNLVSLSVDRSVSPETTLDYEGCDLEYFDHGSPYFYEGFSAEHSSCSGGYYTVSANFIHEVPAGITLYSSHANTTGRMGLNSSSLQTVSLQLTELGTFVSHWGVLMKRYRVTISHTMSEADYCWASTFTAAYRIATDCALLPTIKAAPQSDNLTPNTYKVYQFGASNASSGGVHKFRAFPAVLLCSECHEPALGSTPEHIFEYRLAGTTNWTSIVRNDYFMFEVVVNTAGIYEFRSKGKLKPDNTYSGYTTISIVTVQ